MTKVLHDINVLLDVILDREPFYDESLAAIMRASRPDMRGFIAWHGLATAYYFARRGKSEAEALREVDRMLSWARVITSGDAETHRARALAMPDFEDAMQAAAAEACGADWIITRDAAGFRGSPVPAISPGEFLQRFPLPAGQL